MARPAGFEPATTRLEGGCSIQLSYGRIAGMKPWQVQEKWSEWRDSNPRHSAPKTDALPGCATLRIKRDVFGHRVLSGAHHSHVIFTRQRQTQTIFPS